MIFRLSPYDTILDLSKNDDRKMYLEAAKGLKEANLFTGEKTDFSQFSKLIGKAFRDVRVMECLLIPTKWDTTNTDTELQKLPTKEGLLNQFEYSKVTKEQVQAKSELVWSESTFATTSQHFTKFTLIPTNDDTLNESRNHAKMKHVIMGKKIWSSFTAEFSNRDHGEQRSLHDR